MKPRRPRILARLAVILMCGLFAGMGCASRVVTWKRTITTHPDQTVVETNDVHYENYGFETSTGVLKFERDAEGNPTLVIENLTSEDRGAQALTEGFKAVQSLAK